jgi:hypothetical protein
MACNEREKQMKIGLAEIRQEDKMETMKTRFTKEPCNFKT